jgi:uncharacterized damage-inducible protein DinB
MHTTESVIADLENAPIILLPLVHEIPAANLKRRPAPDVWSAHEHACHLATVQPLFFARLDLMLREDHPVIKPYQPGVSDDADALLNMDLDEALERFAQERHVLSRRLRELSPADWKRTAEHGEYSDYSVFIMSRHFALHDLLHGYRIEELRLKRTWD